jgi:hypothetical protein
MLRDAAGLSLGYINPFKPQGSGKPIRLESENEWEQLIKHVRTFLDARQAKNRGRGSAVKHWSITLVDLSTELLYVVAGVPEISKHSSATRGGARFTPRIGTP